MVGHLQSQCFQKIPEPKAIEVADEKESKQVSRISQFDDMVEHLVTVMREMITGSTMPKLFTDSFVQLFEIIVNAARDEYQRGWRCGHSNFL